MASSTLVMHFPIQIKEAPCCCTTLLTCILRWFTVLHGEIHIEIQQNNTTDSIKDRWGNSHHEQRINEHQRITLKPQQQQEAI